MYLLQTQTKFWDVVEVFTDRDEAIAKAKEFVGQHNPVDGCSTEPIITDYKNPERWTGSRSTSFGLRRAWVHTATTTEPRPIFNIVG